MDQPTCQTCPYWVVYDGDCNRVSPDDIGEDHMDGECHRKAPRGAIGLPRGSESGQPLNLDYHWPMSLRDDFCGEHPDFPAWIASKRAESTA